MLYCSECGKDVRAGAKFCWNCGSTLTQPPAVGPAEYAHSPQAEAKPAGATAFAILSSIVGVGVMVFGFLLLLIPTKSSTLALELGLILLVLGALSVVVGYGLRKGKRWTRLLGTWSGVVFVVLGLLFAASGSYLIVVGVASILFGVAMAYYLRKRNVKEYLERAPR